MMLITSYKRSSSAAPLAAQPQSKLKNREIVHDNNSADEFFNQVQGFSFAIAHECVSKRVFYPFIFIYT